MSLDVLSEGHGLVESPRWHDGRLWFSDWIAGEIIALDGMGATEVMVAHQSLPLCFDFGPDGRLVLVSNQRKALLTSRGRRPPGALRRPAGAVPARRQRHRDRRPGQRLCQQPELRFRDRPAGRHVQPGFVALAAPDGAVRVVAEDIAFPNGMAVTADNSTLIVADSYRHHLVGFDIAADGSLSGRRVWADLGDAAPDGICLDASGAAWYADVPHQRCVRVAEGGEVLDAVPLDRGGFACMLGGPDATQLYIVAARWPGAAGLGAAGTQWAGQVLRTAVAVPGAGWPAR